MDWLLRTNIDSKKFVTQVQDLRDHDVGWRMPEDDELQYDRPAFIGSGKNIIGIYAATMALASKNAPITSGTSGSVLIGCYSLSCLVAGQNRLRAADRIATVFGQF